MVTGYLRELRQDVRHRIRRARHRWTAPQLDQAAIAEALSRLPMPAPGLVCVHSSLSACGYVSGGAATVIRALRHWNARGTLAMPTHSYCYPSGDRPAPVFHPAVTPSVVGAVTDTFWREPGVKRSLHPTHSLAAEGPGAEALIAGHETCDTPCGRGTPYHRLVQQDAAVLMFGATMQAYTLFHTAEDASAVPYLYESQPVALRFRTADHAEHVMSMRRHDLNVVRSFEKQDRWLEARGLLRRVRLGRGELMLVPHSLGVHTALLTELRHDPWFLTTVSV